MTPSSVKSDDLVKQALSGNRRALARCLTRVEEGNAEAQAVLAQIFPHTGQAHIVGITGSPGSGKSTLINCMAREIRRNDIPLAIIAVDPTSPFSGGALLGDRLRMRDVNTDQGVFIRSMASRGHPGGVAHATQDMINVLDAVGFPVIFVETVGSGQAQVEIARLAHTVVLVEAPGMGDDIQSLKAGLMEIADILVVNKADRPEAQRTVQALKSVFMLQVAHQAEGLGNNFDVKSTMEDAGEGIQHIWNVPIIQTNALGGDGVSVLMDAITAHMEFLVNSGQWAILREQHIKAEVEAWFQRHIQVWLAKKLDTQSLNAAVAMVLRGEQDPAAAAQVLLNIILGETINNL